MVRFISNIFSELFDVDKKIMYSNIKHLNNKRDYLLSINANFDQIINDLGIYKKPIDVIQTNAQMKGVLVGAFLSGGSVNSASDRRYHLELRSNNISYLLFIQTILNKFNISIALLQRRKSYILYIKKSYDISDFLKLIGANNCMLEFEDQKISRDLFTQIHRLNNLDISNIKKSSAAGNKQIQKINQIINTDLFKKQTNKFKIFCQIRLKNPNASLNEISKIFLKDYNIKIQRTSVNHLVNKLMSL
ncbi:MAG: DNA-binding protein WhiA [Mycoplasmoidaceae bacterium]|nr:DNA-binding protein WhiA [Mycoplasmoidaceae bacterium]